MFVQSERKVQKYMAICATDITNLYLYSLVALSKETITRHNKKNVAAAIIYSKDGTFANTQKLLHHQIKLREPPEKKIYII